MISKPIFLQDSPTASSTKFLLGIGVKTILTQFYEFISQNIVFNPLITEEVFFWKN